MDVARFAGSPTVEHPLGKAHHSLGVARELLSCEGRRSEAALPLPEQARAGEQAVAENSAYLTPEEAVLRKGDVLAEEDALDIRRIAEEQRGFRPEADGDDIPIAVGAIGEEGQRIATDRWDIAEQGPAFWARWSQAARLAGMSNGCVPARIHDRAPALSAVRGEAYTRAQPARNESKT